MAIRTRDTKEVINKSEGAVVSVSIFLNRMVVQKRVESDQCLGRSACRKGGGGPPRWVFISTARNMGG